MRLSKSDPTGTSSYLADGVAPASDVLTDGHTSFTPGLSEYNALGSRFYLGDAQGNSRGLLDGGQAAQDGYNWDAFGNSVSRFGNNPTAYAWNGAAGYQSDNDSGLKLLGHRYYDSRTGRFLSQDPAGDGDNWYAYADNDPMDGVDPEGLSETNFSYNASMQGQVWGGGFDNQAFHDGEWGSYNQWGPNGSGDGKLYYQGTLTVGPSYLDTMMAGGLGLNMGAAGMGIMFAGQTMKGPGGTTYRQDFKEKPAPDMHIYHSSGGESVINYKGGENPDHGGNPTIKMSRKLRKAYRPIIRKFIRTAALHLGEDGLKALGKFAAKKVPLLGWAITAYSVYQVWRDPDSTWGDYAMAIIF